MFGMMTDRWQSDVNDYIGHYVILNSKKVVYFTLYVKGMENENVDKLYIMC